MKKKTSLTLFSKYLIYLSTTLMTIQLNTVCTTGGSKVLIYDLLLPTPCYCLWRVRCTWLVEPLDLRTRRWLEVASKLISGTLTIRLGTWLLWWASPGMVMQLFTWVSDWIILKVVLKAINQVQPCSMLSLKTGNTTQETKHVFCAPKVRLLHSEFVYVESW